VVSSSQPLVFRYPGYKSMAYIAGLLSIVGASAVPLMTYFNGGTLPTPIRAPNDQRSAFIGGAPNLEVPGWVAYFVLTPIIGILCFLLVRLLWRRGNVENISVANGALTWTSYRGRQVSCRLSDISADNLEKPYNRPGVIGWYTLHTKHGDIEWNTTITNCEDLVALVERGTVDPHAMGMSRAYSAASSYVPDASSESYRAPEPQLQSDLTPHDARGVQLVSGTSVYDYRGNGGLWFLLVLLFVWGAVALGFMIDSIIALRSDGAIQFAVNGKQIDSSTFPWMLLVGLAGLLAMFGALALGGLIRNGKLLLEGTRIAKYDWCGRLKVFDLSRIGPQDIEKIRGRTARGFRTSPAYTYKVKTPEGAVRWDNQMLNGGDELYDQVCAIAGVTRV